MFDSWLYYYLSLALLEVSDEWIIIRIKYCDCYGECRTCRQHQAAGLTEFNRSRSGREASFKFGGAHCSAGDRSGSRAAAFVPDMKANEVVRRAR
jgi:hypothetical protein